MSSEEELEERLKVGLERVGVVFLLLLLGALGDLLATSLLLTTAKEFLLLASS